MQTLLAILFTISATVVLALVTSLLGFTLYYLIGLMICSIFVDQATAFNTLTGMDLAFLFGLIGILHASRTTTQEK